MKFTVQFYSLIFHECIFQVKICLLIAFCSHFPLRHLVKIREVAVCFVCKIDLGHMCSVTVWKELFVHTVSTDAVYLIGRIFLNFLQKFLDRMNDDSIFYLVIFISGKNNIGSVLERKSVWKAFQCLAPHDNDFACCLLAEHLHVCRDAYKKFVIFADGPVFVCCYDNIHVKIPFCFYWFLLTIRSRLECF